MQNALLKRRFNYTLFAAVLIHLVGVFAFGFSWANSTNTSKTIEVTLAQQPANKPVEQADFYAQLDQLGSGTAQQKKRLASVQLDTQNNDPSLSESQLETKPAAQAQPAASLLEKAQQLFNQPVSSFDIVISSDSLQSHLLQQTQEPISPAKDSDKQSISEKIKTLKSQISIRNQQMAKAPKKRVISAMSTKSHQDAAYLESWRQKIITVGNIHYPKAASEQKIYGTVRLLIAMQADGKIRSIEILESSGKKILDHGAIKIIRLAAPFQPFSAQMRKNTDILEIIRTIEFEKTTQIY
jgi:protein TonB